MQVLRRTVVALGAAATLFALAGCGGLGVNFGSGPKGSSGVNHVTIFVTSGVNIPTVNRNSDLALTSQAYDVRGYISTTQGAFWSTSFPECSDGRLHPAVACGGIIVFLDPSCIGPTPVTTTVNPTTFVVTVTTKAATQNICILGLPPGGTQAINATVSGITGTVTITVN
jgi:hypothetical protein